MLGMVKEMWYFFLESSYRDHKDVLMNKKCAGVKSIIYKFS